MKFMQTGLAALFACLLSTGCTVADEEEIYTGYYRQGFEQSDFYTLDGEGPFTLSMPEEVSVQLQEFTVTEPGRGSYLTVSLSFEAVLGPVGDFAYSERYVGDLIVSKLLSAAALPDDDYWAFVEQTKEDNAAE